MATSLRRAVGTPLLYFFILGDILGAGVYVLVGEVAAESGGAVWLPLIVALGLAALTAASYAELATKYPRAGGSAHYATEAFGRAAGSVVGFCMLAAGVVSVAALARAFAGDYLRELVSAPVLPVVVVFLAALAALNIRGVRESLGANAVATAVEVGGLLLIVGLGLWVVLRGDGDPGQLAEVGTPENGVVGATLAGAVLAFYSFVGFETSVNLAEEVRDPRRSYPRALFGALLTAGVVYLLVGLVAGAAVPTDVLAGSDGPLLEVVRAAGAVPPWLFAAVALVAVANGALLTGIMSSRLAYGMSRDGLLPPVLSRVLPGRRTPWVAVLATSALSLLLALTGGVSALAETLVLLLLVVFTATNAAVLALRRRPDDIPHFRVWTAVPWLGLASCLLLFTQIGAAVWLRGAVLLALGGLLALANALRARRTEPATSEA
ncbi:Amino acid transporter [Actinokineospora spheciospongiae]|uniref:Amino acid transporter n=1 Tax=Actinokineospora spheciospongiae TaxID=909613 RepID=W7IIP6_9PSEU|nr:APC family permease [Actinokineospora spheciospongiae]EWC60605.1 Amino acid transporter [Actinokineospora spheciospongiae]PWW65796.1 amino acid/polyamine/organocation transporter (APC superfamily) [Actinokineospora spheciospongiae]